MGRKKNPIIIPLEIILDECWICRTPERHKFLYYAKLDDDVVIYCLHCKQYSLIGNSEYRTREDKIRELKEKYDWIFMSKTEEK